MPGIRKVSTRGVSNPTLILVAFRLGDVVIVAAVAGWASGPVLLRVAHLLLVPAADGICAPSPCPSLGVVAGSGQKLP